MGSQLIPSVGKARKLVRRGGLFTGIFLRVTEEDTGKVNNRMSQWGQFSKTRKIETREGIRAQIGVTN